MTLQEINIFTATGRDWAAFYWLLTLLGFSAVAMFLGAVPPLVYLLGYSAYSLLTLAWTLSGLVALYMMYRYFIHHQKLFGSNDTKDQVVFWCMVCIGLNMGITGFVGTNIFLYLISGTILNLVAGGLCAGVAVYLFIMSQRGSDVFVDETRYE